MLATALAPVIGYDEAAKLAKEAFTSGRTIRELALERGMDAAELDRLLDPAAMTEPGLGGGSGRRLRPRLAPGRRARRRPAEPSARSRSTSPIGRPGTPRRRASAPATGRASRPADDQQAARSRRPPARRRSPSATAPSIATVWAIAASAP